MKRRDFISAAVAAAASPGLAFQASDADTPILKLLHQIEEISEKAHNYRTGLTGQDEDDELDRLFYNRRNRLEAEMMAQPCTCAADFAAKVIVDTVRGDFFSDWKTGALWQETRDLTGLKA